DSPREYTLTQQLSEGAPETVPSAPPWANWNRPSRLRCPAKPLYCQRSRISKQTESHREHLDFVHKQPNSGRPAHDLGKTTITIALVGALICLLGCGSVSNSPNPGPPPPPPPPQPGLESLNHIIFMLQENRSFDHYFGMLNAYRQANGMPQDVDGLAANATNPSLDGLSLVPAFHMISGCTEAPSPSWNESHVDF